MGSKGSTQCVVADLGAHSISGLVESFFGTYFWRFCLGNSLEYQAHKTWTRVFPLRTNEYHILHVQTGYPPDVLHDLFEGIVLASIVFSALCFQIFTK